jgi:hypothetical protein
MKVLLLVHAANQGSDVLLGKLADGCSKELFVF